MTAKLSRKAQISAWFSRSRSRTDPYSSICAVSSTSGRTSSVIAIATTASRNVISRSNPWSRSRAATAAAYRWPWWRMVRVSSAVRLPTTTPHGRTARRLEWPFLPPTLRAEIEGHCGSPVVEAHSQGAGYTPGFASVLVCEDGVAALREGRVGEGAADVRRVLPRGGAQARAAAGRGARAAAAVDDRARLGRARDRPRPLAGSRTGPGGRPTSTPASTPRAGRRGAHARARPGSASTPSPRSSRRSPTSGGTSRRPAPASPTSTTPPCSRGATPR